MKPIFKYASVSIALSELKEKGYTKDFNLELELLKKQIKLVNIDYVYRYEGDESPDDESIVFGIQLERDKGIFVSGYSAEAGEELGVLLIKKISH